MLRRATALAVVVALLVPGLTLALLAPGVALAAKTKHGSASTTPSATAATSSAPAASTPATTPFLPSSPNSPFSPGVPQSPVQPTTTAPPVIVNPTSTNASNSGLSGSNGLVIGIAAVVVITAISFFIWRDARRRAPVRQRAAEATAGGRPGSKARTKPRKLSPAERKRRKRGRAR